MGFQRYYTSNFQREGNIQKSENWRTDHSREKKLTSNQPAASGGAYLYLEPDRLLLYPRGRTCGNRQFLRPDGTIGASGLPDPKRIFIEGRVISTRTEKT